MVVEFPLEKFEPNQPFSDNVKKDSTWQKVTHCKTCKMKECQEGENAKT